MSKQEHLPKQKKTGKWPWKMQQLGEFGSLAATMRRVSWSPPAAAEEAGKSLSADSVYVSLCNHAVVCSLTQGDFDHSMQHAALGWLRTFHSVCRSFCVLGKGKWRWGVGGASLDL